MSCLRLHPESHLVGRTGWLRAAVLGADDGIVSTVSLIVATLPQRAATQRDQRHRLMPPGVGTSIAGFGPTGP